MEKINVLHIITGLSIGGAEKVLLDLCTNLDKDKITNHAIGLNDEKTLTEDFIQNKIPIKALNMKKSVVSFLKTTQFLYKYTKKHNIQILHTHMFHPLIFAFILKIARPKLKIVFTSHNVNIGSKLREAITYLLKPFRDTDIVFSKDMITRIYVKNTKVIPNGIDTSLYKKKIEKTDKYVFISVGVLREQKNQLFLPSCARYLKDNGVKNFEIQIVGGANASGDMREEIKAEIKKYGVEDEVKMLGPRRDIQQLLQKADCFVMPSHFEGLPIALLEAGASSLVVNSTPVGAIPSVINKETGYLSDLDNFAKTMEEIINNPKEAQRRADNLHKIVVDQFSIKSMAKAHEDLYLSIIEGE